MMKKLKQMKLLMLGVALLLGSAVSAQKSSYGTRQKAISAQEQKIDIYTSLNRSRTPSKVLNDYKATLKPNGDHPHSYTAKETTAAVEEFKTAYWRMQYFIDNPDAQKLYASRAVAGCENGGFEDGNFNNYSLWVSSNYSGGECNFVNGSGPVMSPAPLVPNNFQIMDNTVTPTDPLVGIATTNSGRYSARINSPFPCYPGFGVNRLTRKIILGANQSSVGFSYALVLEYPNNPHIGTKPTFIARALDPNGNELDRTCKVSSTTNPFFQYTFNDNEGCNYDTIVYSQWFCSDLSLAGNTGDTITLEFYVTDCGQGAHFGYGYIDDICEDCDPDPCDNTGSINLTPADSCWDTTSTFQVCGTYTLPAINCIDGTLDTILLSVIQNGVTTLISLPASQININETAKTFCFTLNASDFPSTTNGGYDFKVDIFFNLAGGIVTESDYNTNPGVQNDVVFSCVPMEKCFIESIRPTKPGDVIPVNPDKPTFVGVNPTLGGPTTGTSFVQYEPVNRIITSDEVWHGKIYIPSNVIITVEGALLDLTNVDVIFGECAGIRFTKNAVVRANNSVFRPCNINETWLGFIFDRTADGIINESTFKSAQFALMFNSVEKAQVRIVNNLFQNCRIGIAASRTNMLDGISGNTFNIDKNDIKYKVECRKFDASSAFLGLEYQDDHWGIIAESSNFYGNISQNDFVNAQEVEGSGISKFFYGISLNQTSSATLSDNNFTDLYRSIDLAKSGSVNIDNNEIEVNSYNYYGTLKSEHQMRISSSSNINVTNNELLYAFRNQSEKINWSTHSAIYVENGGAIALKTNKIKGFESGIQLQRVEKVSVNENNLMDIGHTGIFVQGGAAIDVLCNTLNMEDDYKNEAIGIYYITQSEKNPEVRFSSNCIFEASTAMLLVGPREKCYELPFVSNNFMYNYTSYGIDVHDLEGNIGTSGTVKDAGRNTFASNNTTTGSVDLRAVNCTVNADGNYGIVSTAGNVNVGSTIFYSTATCGLQMPMNSDDIKLNYNETCDPKFYFNESPLKKEGGKYVLKGDAEKSLKGYDTYDRYAYGWLNAVSTDDAKKLYDLLAQDKGKMNSTLLAYYFEVTQANYSSGLTLLSKLKSEKVVSNDRYTFEKLRLEHLMNPKAISTSSSIVTQMTALTTDRTVVYDVRQFLQFNIAGNDFPFEPIPTPTVYANGAVKLLDAKKLIVYPNPVKDVLKVDYFIPTEGAVQINVIDINGKVQSTQSRAAKSGQVELNIASLARGTYIVQIVNSSGETESTQFIKL